MNLRYSTNQKKKKPYIKWIITAGVVLVATAVAVWLYLHDWDVERSVETITESMTGQPGTPEEMPEEATTPHDLETPKQPEPDTAGPESEPEPETPAGEDEIDATTYPEDVELPEEPTYIDGILLANKQHPLPESYAPGEDEEARAAFESMKAEALEEGIDLVAFSTYRNFDRQKQLYESYVAKDGQEAADRYSARPGFSEHQTGLAFDIGEAGQEQHWVSTTFGETEGGKWLADHAHDYGFILRYPEDSESITGYMHESWHFRYVGEEAAAEIFETDVTLEEYLGIH